MVYYFYWESASDLRWDSVAEFRPQDGQEHKRLAREYHELPNEKECAEFFKENSARYFELSRLSYFDPVHMMVIDPMHNILLGMVLLSLLSQLLKPNKTGIVKNQ